jgi:hypothetical protein
VAAATSKAKSALDSGGLFPSREQAIIV